MRWLWILVGAFGALDISVPANAQQFVDADVSVGGSMLSPVDGHVFGGWYVEGTNALFPSTAFAAQASGQFGPEGTSRGKERWYAVLAGVRQYIVRQHGVRVFVEFMAGGANYEQRFSNVSTNSFWSTAFQPGAGVNIPLDERWAVQLRTSARVALAGDGADAGWMVGGGVGRYWGRR